MNNNLSVERIKEIRQYLKNEIKKNFSEYQSIELDIPAEFEHQSTYTNLHQEIKNILSNQENHKEYYYIFMNKNEVDLGDKVVYSNNKYHVVYEIFNSRFSYFDKQFNYIGQNKFLAGYAPENAIHGKSFSIERNSDFNLNFETSQFKKIGLSISKNDENIFEISASGKNKVKTITFNNEKKEIKATVVNCFIKNIMFDLEGSIQSIGIKNKISKELFLNKTQFEVNNYSDLIKAIKAQTDLDFYTLMTDDTLDIINQSIFDSQIALVKNVIAYKTSIDNKMIYHHIDSIKEFFNQLDIEPRRVMYKLKAKELQKYKIYFDKNHHYDYIYPKQTLSFLSTLKIKNIDFNYFLNETILNHFKELNVFADGFRDLFKEDIKNNKQNKIKESKTNQNKASVV